MSKKKAANGQSGKKSAKSYKPTRSVAKKAVKAKAKKAPKNSKKQFKKTRTHSPPAATKQGPINGYKNVYLEADVGEDGAEGSFMFHLHYTPVVSGVEQRMLLDSTDEASARFEASCYLRAEGSEGDDGLYPDEHLEVRYA